MYTIQQLIEFTESKTGNYEYGNLYNCAMAQFLKAQGHVKPKVGGSFAQLETDGMTSLEVIDAHWQFLDGNMKSTEKIKTFKDLFSLTEQWKADELDLVIRFSPHTWEELTARLKYFPRRRRY